MRSWGEACRRVVPGRGRAEQDDARIHRGPLPLGRRRVGAAIPSLLLVLVMSLFVGIAPAAGPTQAEVEKARAEYLEAFMRYTTLTTRGGPGNVEEALKAYREAHKRFTDLLEGKSAAGEPLPSQEMKRAPAPDAPVAKPVRPKTNLRIAVFSPKDPPDDLEQLLGQLLGQLSWLDYILQPLDPREFFRMLRVHIDAGRRADYLVFAGHGSAGEPHIKLRGKVPGAEESIGLQDVDISYWRREYAGMLERLRERRHNRDDILCGGEAGAKGAELKQIGEQIDRLLKLVKERKEWLERLETSADLMNKGGKVLLLNCSPAATPEGIRFVENLGMVLLGKHGGTVTAPDEDLHVAQVESQMYEWLSGTKVGDIHLSTTWRTFEIPGMPVLPVLDGVRPVLDVGFDPAAILADEGQRLEVSPQVDPMKDSGALRYFWNGASEPTASSRFPVVVAGKPVTVDVVVWDERGRQGADYITIYPKKAASGCKPLHLCKLDSQFVAWGTEACESCQRHGAPFCSQCEVYKRAVDACAGGNFWIPDDSASLGARRDFSSLRELYRQSGEKTVRTGYFESLKSTACYELIDRR